MDWEVCKCEGNKCKVMYMDEGGHTSKGAWKGEGVMGHGKFEYTLEGGTHE